MKCSMSKLTLSAPLKTSVAYSYYFVKLLPFGSLWRLFMKKLLCLIVALNALLCSKASLADPFDQCDEFMYSPEAHNTCLEGVSNRLKMQMIADAIDKQNKSNPLYGCSLVSEIEADTVEEANALAIKIGGNRIRLKKVTKRNVTANVYKCP